MNEHIKKFNQIKNLKLAASITIDLMGFASYLFPVVGQTGDLVWGPISGFLIYVLYPERKKRAIAGAIEEMLPFTDFIPMAYLTWRQEYVKDAERTLSKFLHDRISEEKVILEIQNKSRHP